MQVAFSYNERQFIIMLILPNNKSQIKPYIYNSWTRKYFIKSKKHIKTKKKVINGFQNQQQLKLMRLERLI